MPLTVKICGLTTPYALDVALKEGADMVGLVFHPKSPRYVRLEQASSLAAQARGEARVAALVVDAQDGALEAIRKAVGPDLWQLHGQESPERVAALRASLAGLAMKAIGVGEAADLRLIPAYAAVADHILLDARPPKDAAYPGGHGRPFDWAILEGLDHDQPFVLSGGLTPDNVADAIGAMRAMGLALAGVDVSSGVESAPGVKDPEKIRAFIAAAREAGG
ncbi:MAG: phosphoribosylanthranilate isomerase [Beijerinckiaceae bacterium]